MSRWLVWGSDVTSGTVTWVPDRRTSRLGQYKTSLIAANWIGLRFTGGNEGINLQTTGSSSFMAVWWTACRRRKEWGVRQKTVAVSRSVGTDFLNFRECLDLRYIFCRQSVLRDSKRGWRQRVGARNTRNERSGSTVCSLTSPALQFQERPQSKQNWPHTTQPNPLPARNA
jgi:hypothetical protein